MALEGESCLNDDESWFKFQVGGWGHSLHPIGGLGEKMDEKESLL